MQTLRQLLPAAIESPVPVTARWVLPGGSIVDQPRFPYRGAMLDVARHFFAVEDVLRVVDHLARYKLNHLHLHLTDDQGWRIAIDSWPRLATVGGATEVGGGPGGHYTKADYRRIVSYAAARHVTVVPEIDLPGHTNTALVAYPELAPDKIAPPPYTGTEVGFSYVDPADERTYDFIADVLGELADLTPGRGCTSAAMRRSRSRARCTPVSSSGRSRSSPAPARPWSAGTSSRRPGTSTGGSCSGGAPPPRTRPRARRFSGAPA
ncbi:hypothetical protein GCM10027614_31250 [Micromonospora vulcania]